VSNGQRILKRTPALAAGASVNRWRVSYPLIRFLSADYRFGRVLPTLRCNANLSEISIQRHRSCASICRADLPLILERASIANKNKDGHTKSDYRESIENAFCEFNPSSKNREVLEEGGNTGCQQTCCKNNQTVDEISVVHQNSFLIVIYFNSTVPALPSTVMTCPL
jgi:hypothetical protein